MLNRFGNLVQEGSMPDAPEISGLVKDFLTPVLVDQSFDEGHIIAGEIWRLFIGELSKYLHNPKFVRFSRHTNEYIQVNVLDKWSKNRTEAHLDIVLAAYYYAHTSSNETFARAANEIDKAFLGQPFEEMFGAPVPMTDEEASEIENAYRTRKSDEAKNDVSVPKSDEDAETLPEVLEGEDNSTHQSTKHKWLQPKRLRLLATVALVSLVAATISLVVGWPREQTNLFLFEVASKLLPFHNSTQEFVSGFNYESDPLGLIESVRAQAGTALLHELYNRNSSLAAGMLGSRYSHGSFVKKDTEKALQYLHFAAHANDPRALGVLANMLSNGVRIDTIARTDEGVFEYSNELFKRAADVDVTPQTMLPIAVAQNSLGWSYRLGRGVPQDFNRAIELFNLAIENGSPLAINNLGTMYAAGLGVPANNSKATELYKKAYEKGNEFGLLNLAYNFADGAVPEKGNRDAAKLYKEGKDRGNA